MTPSEFDEALDRYGADLSTWPGPLRAAAAKLLEASSTAAAAWDDMVAIERVLKRTDATAGSSAGEIAARASHHRQKPRLALWLPQAGWAAAAAAVLCIGVYLGQLAQQYEQRPSYVMRVALPHLETFDVD